MGFGDGWALYRALQATRTRDGPVLGHYNMPAALRIFQEERAPFLLRVEKQMGLDVEDAKFVAAAREDEAEWIRRFKERNPENQWLTEHDTELELQKAIMGQSRLPA